MIAMTLFQTVALSVPAEPFFKSQPCQENCNINNDAGVRAGLVTQIV
jgi:hypothetical protein